MTYDIVARGQVKLFAITGALTEGYETTGKAHDINEVVAAHHAWQAATGTVLGGLISANTISYGLMQEDTIRSSSEAGWKFEGCKSVLHQKDLTDEDFLTRLLSLAAALAETLGQTRVYVSYAEENLILQRTRAQTSRVD